MAKAFKDYYDGDAARLLAEKLGAVEQAFAAADFVAEIEAAIEGKGFLERQDIFAAALERAFGGDVERGFTLLEQVLGEPLAQSAGMFTYGWWLWPVGRWVERNALADRERTLAFSHELTRRFTAEFALRPVVREWPEWTLRRLVDWAGEGDVHVRRCASEVIRVALPWASRLDVAHTHHEQWRAVLEPLRADPEKFVQKSVGNNLNDLMKASPALATAIIDEWSAGDPPAATRWIVKHGTRSLRRGWFGGNTEGSAPSSTPPNPASGQYPKPDRFSQTFYCARGGVALEFQE